MKIEKFKVLLYLKKSGLDKNGKAPIMGRITVNRTMAQFSCKLSCTPSLWNPRASRLEGSVKTQTTLLSFVDEHISELSTHEGIDMSKSSVWTYRKIRKNLAEFIGEKYRLTDLAFGQLTEPFISDFHHYLLDEKGFSSGTITIYVSLFKKMCRIAFERGLCKNLLFAHYRVGTPKVTTPKALSMSDFIKIRDVELPEDEVRDTLFPLLNTNRVRIDLITICKLAETSKTYSYHSGRHSFASLITLEAGVPMETICKMLGHKDVKMTQRYARVTQKKLFIVEWYRTSKARQTFLHKRTWQKNLRAFVHSLDKDDIAFEDIDENFGEEYKLFLKRDQGRIDSYVNHCLLWLNMLMYKAVDRIIIRFNPIAKIGYEKKAAHRQHSQDDGTRRHYKHTGLCAGDGAEDFK